MPLLLAVPNHLFVSLRSLKVKEPRLSLEKQSNLYQTILLYHHLMKLFKALPLFQLKKQRISDVFTEHFISSGSIFENDKSPPAGSNQNAPQTSSMEHFTNQEVLNALISIAARKSSGAHHLESKLLILAAILLLLHCHAFKLHIACRKHCHRTWNISISTLCTFWSVNQTKQTPFARLISISIVQRLLPYPLATRPLA